MGMKQVLSKELQEISLLRLELTRLQKISREFIRCLKQQGLTARIGGSLAKGTMIGGREKQDIDFFVVFDRSDDVAKLGGILEKLSLPGKLEKLHGSRDYFRVVCKDAILEVIPVVKNRDPNTAENVTDVSLAHVTYVVQALRKNPDLADQIKLAKAFCIAQGCYGAESYIRGFSGYALEVLVIYFGGFIPFLQHVGKKKVIDPKKQFRNAREVMHELNSSKLLGPLVVVDPTYKYRNVTAGLGSETFEKFLCVSKQFLKQPSLDFFRPQPLDVTSMKQLAKKKRATLLQIDLRTSRKQGDVAGAKMKKFFDFFSEELLRKQQEIFLREFDYSGVGSTAVGYLVVKQNKEVAVRGPLVGLEESVEAFKKAKGSRAFKKGKYWWFKETVDIRKVFKSVSSVEKEMGAGGRIRLLS